MFADPFRLAVMLGLLVISGFFSGSESALFSLDAVSVRRLRGRGGAGALATRLLHEPDLLLVTILFGNMLVNITYIVLAASISQVFGTAYAAAAWSAGTLLALIIVGEVIPKAIAVSSPALAASIAAYPLYSFTNIVGRLVYAPLKEFVKRSPSGAHGAISPEDLKYLVELSARRRKITKSEREMLADVLTLAEIRVKDVMVPSVEAITVDADASIGRVLRRAVPSGTHYLPVVDEDTDEVVGVINFVQCLGLVELNGPEERRKSLRPLIKSALYVPEAAPCNRLLKTLRENPGQNLLIVVDEYGGFAGMVTAEDLVEVFLGPLRDEYEISEEFDAEEIRPGVFRVPGDLPVREWFELLDLGEMPEEVPVSTIAGFFMYLTGRLPEQGDEARFGNLRLIASGVEGHRLIEVTVEADREPEERVAGEERGR